MSEKVSKPAWKTFLGRYLAGCVTLALAGTAVALMLMNDADRDDPWLADQRSCNTPRVAALTGGLTAAGLPTSISTALGYGRGRHVIENTVITVTPADGVDLPPVIGMELLPLGSDTGPAITDVGAIATQVGNTSSYTLKICIDGSGVRAGAYKASLLFTDPRVTFENTPVVEATFQNRLVPYMLWSWVPLAVPVGVFYMALMLIRRAKPTFAPFTDTELIKGAFGSWNGVVAVLAGMGAAFGAWQATCFQDPTWGASWPDVLKAAGTIAAAAATAASLPLGFSAQPIEDTPDQ